VLVASAIPPEFDLPDHLWEQFRRRIPQSRPSCRGGRPRVDDRQCLTAIAYILRTGIQWGALPRSLGAKSTVYDRFREWCAAGIFTQAWKDALRSLDRAGGIDWEWQSMDGGMTKAPLGGEATGPNPTDRGKLGVKRSLLVNGRGTPLAVAVAPANVHDMRLVAETLDARLRAPPPPLRPNLCLDRGYDYPEIYDLVRASRFRPHIRSRREEVRRCRAGEAPRRWVVERTLSWLNRCRRILVRWDKKVEHYLAFLHLACARLIFRTADSL
jgi:putative transposase